MTAELRLYHSDWNNIVNNEINKNYFNGVVLYESDGNLVKCNDIIDNRGTGVLIAGSKGNEILKNDIKTCIPASACIYVRDTGLLDGTLIEFDGPATETAEGLFGRTSDLNQIHENSIIADGPYTLAIINNSCNKLDAQCNWFGCNKDPCCLIGGSGVTLYCPWLTKEPANCGCHVKKEKKSNETTKKSANAANAANVTTTTSGVPMQTTGAPLIPLALALLAVFGGLVPKRK